MGMVVGGDKAWKVMPFRDLVIAYHWINDEPTMVLYPRNRVLRYSGAVPYGLPLASCHELVKADTKGVGVDTVALLTKARTAAEVMGMGGDYSAIRNVADCLLHGIDDLLRMPPTPDEVLASERPAPIGEFTFRENGEIIKQGEL
jgi:hypothetical protein